MQTDDRSKLDKLIQRWEGAAERLENQSVKMTANTHRLFANELKVVLSKIPVSDNIAVPWYKRLFQRK